MNTKALQSSIWLTNIILLFLAISLFFGLSLYYYYAYSFNSLIKVEFIDRAVACDAPDWWVNTKTTLLVITNLIALYIFWKIRETLFLIRDQGPFVDAVANKLRMVFYWAIALLGVKILADFVLELFIGEVQVELSSTTLILLFFFCIVYVLVEIIEYGVTIREEQKLTI
jgi:hypothetical protein